jgi:hypothetical protein
MLHVAIKNQTILNLKINAINLKILSSKIFRAVMPESYRCLLFLFKNPFSITASSCFLFFKGALKSVLKSNSSIKIPGQIGALKRRYSGSSFGEAKHLKNECSLISVNVGLSTRITISVSYYKLNNNLLGSDFNMHRIISLASSEIMRSSGKRISPF